MDRCHLYLPLVDNSGVTYRFAEVTLLDTETGTPIEEPVYLDPYGGAPQQWPILIDPAVINFWTDSPLRVTVQALLPGGSTFTRPGVDICPAPPATVRTQHPLHIGPADGLDGTAMLAVSPDGSAVWQVLDSLRTHRHEGDAPESTVLGPADLTDIYPSQTWLGNAITGVQGARTVALGAQSVPNAEEAVALGRATAGLRGVAVGGAANAYTSSVAVGAATKTTKLEQVTLGRNVDASPGPQGAVLLGSNTVSAANTAVKSRGLHVTSTGSVILGNGTLPDLSWLSDEYVAILGSAVAARFFAARRDASLAGPSSTVGFYGNPGTFVPLLNSVGITPSTPGQAALTSLLSALDRLGLIALTDGAIDDELADWSKSFAHNANMVLETGDADGSKGGDLARAKRNGAGPGTITYTLADGIRDFRARVFAWQLAVDPAVLATELVADVSPNGTTWTRVTLAWQPLAATAASWYQTWAANARPLPAGTKYVRFTVDVNTTVFTPQIGRVLVRPIVPTVLTTTALTGPDRLQVSDHFGVLATLTVGAKTVAMRGPQRTFTEQARPFADSFDRTTSNGWGPSPGGGSWSKSNGEDSDYSVSGGLGKIKVTSADSSRHTSLINDLADCDARLSWSLDAMPTGNASSLALSFGYTASTSHYRARLSVLTSGTVQMALERQTPDGTVALGNLFTVGTGYKVGDIWHIRAQRTGATLRCRAWKDGTTEPTSWVHQVDDSTLGAGRIGVRGFATAGSTAPPFTFNVHDIQLYSGTWPDPPVVSHDTWVRLLAAPFSGTWTTALATQILNWSVDTSSDVLAYAMKYITGAPVVTSPTYGGAQIAGQARYGPSGPDGKRIEGADFHDYMGMNWTFPNGETQTAGADEAGCLDCSGFVRMVYGFNMGIPMVRSANFDGLNLPRQTKDIGPSGPGILVADETDTPPELVSLQIGDVPHFDADSSDTATGQLDHNGIYLGLDNAGNHRFINSRKTPNGPTFADLGGTSTLNGTGTYAVSLRKIRRF